MQVTTKLTENFLGDSRSLKLLCSAIGLPVSRLYEPYDGLGSLSSTEAHFNNVVKQHLYFTWFIILVACHNTYTLCWTC